MSSSTTPIISDFDLFVFDFDGVLTNNKVYVNQDGKESVECSRSDGLAFDVLRKLNKSSYIISTEKNPVVEVRAKKLKVDLLQGIDNKLEALKEVTEKHQSELSRVLYVGNDLNDYYAMKSSGFSVCPFDSHITIQNLSDVVLNTSGGNGVVRELLEGVFELNFIEILYN